MNKQQRMELICTLIHTSTGHTADTLIPEAEKIMAFVDKGDDADDDDTIHMDDLRGRGQEVLDELWAGGLRPEGWPENQHESVHINADGKAWKIEVTPTDILGTAPSSLYVEQPEPDERAMFTPPAPPIPPDGQGALSMDYGPGITPEVGKVYITRDGYRMKCVDVSDIDVTYPVSAESCTTGTRHSYLMNGQYIQGMTHPHDLVCEGPAEEPYIPLGSKPLEF